MPKYARESARTFQSAKARHALWLRGSLMPVCSCWIADESQSRSSAVSQAASAGRSVRKWKVMKPSTNCGDAFEEEEPLPASQTEQAVELHEGT